jgi:hypothetical protein
LSYKQMSLIDLKLDKNKMKGQLVEVRGHLVLTGDMGALGSELFDANPLMIDFQMSSVGT